MESRKQKVQSGKRKIWIRGISVHRRHLLRLSFLFLFSILHFSLSITSAFAQDDPPEAVPPPAQAISREERAKLDAVEDDLKDWTVLSIEMMAARLKQAETALAGDNPGGVHRELGGFHYLMDNTLAYLDRRNNDSSAIRNNFKRFEIALRTFSPRVELIRREIAPPYEPYVLRLLKYLRETRTKAIEPQFGRFSLLPSIPSAVLN